MAAATASQPRISLPSSAEPLLLQGRPPPLGLPRSASAKVETGFIARLGELADDAADGLQGWKLVVLQVQGLVGSQVLLGEHLPAGGADAAVQVGARVRLPGALPGPPGLAGLQAVVGSQQLLLFGGVGQQHEELIEDPLEVLSQELLAAAVVLSGRDQTLGGGEGGSQAGL